MNQINTPEEDGYAKAAASSGKNKHVENLTKFFKPTNWAIDNRTSIYIVTVILTLMGISTYNSLQKEKFPDIVIPTIITSVVYPGTSPTDIENLVTRPIEKQLKGVSGVKKITSQSVQDYCIITAEFNTGIAVAEAKQRIKDAVDKAQTDLPNDLPNQPNVVEVNFSEFPILYVNLSGDYPLDKIKVWGEKLQDEIEGLKEITRVDIVGALEKEIQIDVDMYRMQAAKLTFTDVERAIQSENATISAGTVRIGDMKRSVRIAGQYVDPNLIANIVIKSSSGAAIRLGDVAEVREGYKERESFARLDHKPVITLNIIKRSGENLIDASDKVRKIVENMKASTFPKDLKITLTGDQSNDTRNTVQDLINTIVIGFILVVLILMFFMGTTNAIFVGLSVPISALLAFLVLPAIGFTLNMIVLFSFLLALGIVVDDAIVVIENTHRIVHTTKLGVVKSAKAAAGEVFVPVLAGTLTTVAPFIPLSFWPGIIGKFMMYLPITLIIVLFASLVVAFLINPVFAVSFMHKEGDESVPVRKNAKKRRFSAMQISLFVMGVLALLLHLKGNRFGGNLLIVLLLLVLAEKYVFSRMIAYFQAHTLPAMMNGYERLLRRVLKGNRTWGVVAAVAGLFVLSIILTIAKPPKSVFFPQGDPKFIYTYITLPIGTDLQVTDSIAKIVEQRIYGIIGEHNPDVESVITNVAVGAGDAQDQDRSTRSNKAKVGIAFKELADRTGPATKSYMVKISEAVRDIPAAVITVDKESSGPPQPKPINIEVSGEDYPKLITLSKDLQRYIAKQNISGIENLRSDLQDQNPEIGVEVDRERANREGISTAQIGMELRTAIFGFEASKFKRDEDEYPIQVRYSETYRKSIDALSDLRITYRDMNSGQVRQIPLSAVTKVSYGNTLGSVRRKNLKRVITLSSNVLTGYNANEVADQVQNAVMGYKSEAGYEVKMTGAEDQQETASFLGFALLLSIGLIFLILVTQFNSLSKPIIIMTEIVFSIAGVLIGYFITGMEISIVMTGVGILALAGIVVKNGILLVEFADELKARGLRTFEAVVMAGKTRLNPVILTATACVLGLVPLAIGMNINFYNLLDHGDAEFFIGGESMVFWGPLAWTIIFGLSFATFLTLVVVPAMYLINYKLKIGLKRAGILPMEVKK